MELIASDVEGFHLGFFAGMTSQRWLLISGKPEISGLRPGMTAP